MFENFEHDFDKTFKIKFLNLNNYCYREGTLIIYKSKIFEIKYILTSDEKYWFVCVACEPTCFHKFYNALELKVDLHSNELKLISLNDMDNKATYTKISTGNTAFVKCENLELRKELFL